MYTAKMQDKILQAIETSSITQADFNGERINVKNLQAFHLVVEVIINQFESELLNGDVCKVLYECVDDPGYVIVQRMEDAKQSKIRKDVLRIPVEFMNFEQYLLGGGLIKPGDF